MPSPRERALKLAAKFAGRPGGGAFPNIRRRDVARTLDERIRRPGRINQASASLCGPASLLYTEARSNPVRYAWFAISLYERGRASLGKLSIRPGSDLRKSSVPSGIAAVDWITLASIRDSENWFFDYQSAKDEFAGITMPGTLEDWFRRAGYRFVHNETNVFFCKDIANAMVASRYYQRGYKVCLFINANMIGVDPKTGRALMNESSTTPDHWVVLTSPITIRPGDVNFTIYTWGRPHFRVPIAGRKLSRKAFLDNYYGYIACAR